MKKQELFECFGILLLALVLAVSLITMTRTCEERNHFNADGSPYKTPCVEIRYEE